MATPQLNLDHVTGSQANKETTVNTGLDGLDNAMNALLDKAAGDITLTDTEFRSYVLFRILGTIGVPKTLTIPNDIKRLFAVKNSTDATIYIENENAVSSGLDLASGLSGIYYSDGDDLISMGSGGGGGSLSIEDEGSEIVAAAEVLNFVGAGVVVTDVSGVATITISGGGGGSLRISDNGVLVDDAAVELNFKDGFTVNENSDGVIDIDASGTLEFVQSWGYSPYSGTTASTSAYAAKGYSFTLAKAVSLNLIEAYLDPSGTNTYVAYIGSYDSVADTIEAPLYVSGNVTMTSTSNGWATFNFPDAPMELPAGDYIVLVVITSGTTVAPCRVSWGTSAAFEDDFISNILSTRVLATSFAAGDDVSYAGGTGTGDAQSIRLIGSSGAAVSVAHDLSSFIGGVALDEELVFYYIASRPFRLAQNLEGSTAKANTASTGTLRWVVFKNSVQIGVIEFAASDTGVFSGDTTDFAIGDRLAIVSDEYNYIDTLADVGITIFGSRLN